MADLIDKLSEEAKNKANKKAMPDWLDPMLAKLPHDYFSGDDWIFERKLDGERVLAYVVEAGEVNLFSRNKKELNDSYPEIQEALEKHAVQGCILDGETVAFNDKHVSDFQKLQPRMGVSSREEAMESDGTGFDDQTLRDLRGKLEQIERKTSPYDQGEPDEEKVHFVSPEMVCEVAFSEWTADDRLRHPRYKGLRRDKSPEDVHKEQERQVTELEREEEP